VQSDLELPAPAIAVNGIDGYQLWFSLAEPVPVKDARTFLDSLRSRYLVPVADERIAISPSLDASVPGKVQLALLVPAQRQETGFWSSFVAPDLAAIFSEEPWLDVSPSPDAQAKVLSRLECIQPAVFQAILESMRSSGRMEKSPMPSTTFERDDNLVKAAIKLSAPQTTGLDPKRFLQDVMNDTTVELGLRIEAAKALLPYFQEQ
jgi:hypothetical protein